MSLAIKPVRTVRVLDPITDINQRTMYTILQGGNEVSYKTVTSTSYSNSSAQFTAPPPSPGVIVDRKIWLKMPVKIEFNGESGGIGQGLLQSGFDAFRAYPLAQMTNVLNVMINNTSVSINLNDSIGALLRYHNTTMTKEYEYSMTPTHMDESQNYDDLVNTIRNPLGYYGDSNGGDVEGRGSFPYRVFTNTATNAVVEADLCEPLFLSPLLFGHGDRKGFVGVQNFTFTFTWDSNLERIWSHAPSSGSIYTINVTLGQPQLLFKYITPKQLTMIPRSIEYDYNIVNRYPTNSGSFNIEEVRTIQSQNIQLQSIPKRVYIYARVSNSSRGYQDCDTYLAIQNINVNWNNRSGLLSSATQQDLYNISKNNGVDMSWNQWSGGPSYFYSGSDIIPIGTIGSVLCLQFGRDIGLSDLEAPGLDGTYQFQFNVTLKNVNQAQPISDVTLYAVVISQGVFTVLDNRAISQIGVITRQDILDSKDSPFVDYNDIMYMNGYGNFFGDLKKFGQDVFRGIEKYAPKALKFVKEDLLPLAKELAPYIMPLLGMGKMKKMDLNMDAGVLVGGELMDRQQLRNRIKQLEY